MISVGGNVPMNFSNSKVTPQGVASMPRLKKVVWIFPAILFVLIGGTLYLYANLEKYVQPRFVPPASVWVDEDKPLHEQTAIAQIGGRKFQIPLMYIENKKPLNGVFKEDILLEVVWPEIKSIYELKDRAEYDRITRKEHKRGWILMESASLRPSLDAQIENRRKYLAKEESAGSFEGLEKYLWFNPSPQGPQLHDEVYLEKDASGHILTRIECHPDAMGKFPQCQQKFIDNGVIFELIYNKRAFLVEWREQRERAVQFLRSMEIVANNPNSEGK